MDKIEGIWELMVDVEFRKLKATSRLYFIKKGVYLGDFYVNTKPEYMNLYHTLWVNIDFTRNFDLSIGEACTCLEQMLKPFIDFEVRVVETPVRFTTHDMNLI